MKRNRIRGGLGWALALVVGAAMVPAPASAVVTATWNVDTYRDWSAGDPSSAFITSLGELRPGWATSRTKLAVDGTWSAVRGPGGAVFVGTDDDGSIYKVAKGTAKKLASIKDVVAVVSLASRGSTLYAGTMPKGEVWKIDAISGQAARLATLKGAETVWALALSKDGRDLYAGTGPDGHLFRVNTRTGKARVVFDSDDKRIQSLVVGPDGSVWLGTSSKAIVFRFDPKRGVARAMADFNGNEITAMVRWRGGVIATVNNIRESSSGALKTRSALERLRKGNKGHTPKLPRTGSKPGAERTAATRPPRRGARKGKGALFRIRADGRFEQIHALTSTYYASVAVDGKGRIFAGAGDRGRIYMIDGDAVSTVFDVRERLIAHILPRKGGLQFVSGDAAAFYSTTGLARKASYESKVFDNKVPSRFGKLVWRGAGRVLIETRSGNTARPGKGWSGWAKPRRARGSGGGSRSAKIASPSGRYFQFRVGFRGDSGAVVRGVRYYYLPQNRATKITSIKVGGASARTGVTLGRGVTKSRSPVLKLSWGASNPDRDTTHYKLAVRREGEVLWRTINTGARPLSTTRFSWNTEAFPDGYYRLRVTSSDRPSNSGDRALTASKTSRLFLVDNGKPRVSAITVRYPQVSARGVDAMSAIHEMAFAVDDGPWMLGGAADGIFDDPVEMLRIKLPSGLKRGVHTLSIRVADEAGNVGSTSVSFRVR